VVWIKLGLVRLWARPGLTIVVWFSQTGWRSWVRVGLVGSDPIRPTTKLRVKVDAGPREDPQPANIPSSIHLGFETLLQAMTVKARRGFSVAGLMTTNGVGTLARRAEVIGGKNDGKSTAIRGPDDGGRLAKLRNGREA